MFFAKNLWIAPAGNRTISDLSGWRDDADAGLGDLLWISWYLEDFMSSCVMNLEEIQKGAVVANGSS